MNSIKKGENDQTNSFIKKSKFKYRYIIIMIYILIIFVAEYFFRKPLNEITFKIEYFLQNKLDISIFENLSFLGNSLIYLPIVVYFYLFHTLNKSFTLFSVMIHSFYWENILKIVYGQSRPYWNFKQLTPSCFPGFGNPSGHSMSSIAFYLSLWRLVTNDEKYEKKPFLKGFLFFGCFILILIVAFSRMVLAAHYLNQIFFGNLLGLGIYFIHFYLFNMHEKDSRLFFEIFKSKKKRKRFILFYSFLIFLGLTLYIFIPNTDVIDEHNKYILDHCSKAEEFKKFNEDALFNCFSIFALIGAHLGLVFLVESLEKNYLFDKNKEIFRFNSTSIANRLYIFVFLIIFGSPVILFYFIPGRINIILVFLFKIILPLFFSSFGMFGINIWFCIFYRYCNRRIFKFNLRDSFKEIFI